MARALLKSLAELRAYVRQRVSQQEKISGGQGESGWRRVPAQGGNHDKQIGSRVDIGPIVVKDGEEFRRYKWQLNRSADDSTLAKMEQENQHKVWAEADVPVCADKSKASEASEKMFDDMEADIKRREEEEEAAKETGPGKKRGQA
ncbi:MAG: hypothetical protein LQ346_007342 [Caloplaca aetnensis]|nr:MAG: hypothetical protein LQ346_007342 [Caloplaca aetnensis]